MLSTDGSARLGNMWGQSILRTAWPVGNWLTLPPQRAHEQTSYLHTSSTFQLQRPKRRRERRGCTARWRARFEASWLLRNAAPCRAAISVRERKRFH